MAATWEESSRYLFVDTKAVSKDSDYGGKKMAWIPVPGDDGFAKVEILKQEGDDCQVLNVNTNEVSTIKS